MNVNLVEDNIKLVSYVYSRLIKTPFVVRCAEDIKQEGMFGLMRAADRFNPKKGAFSTYAYKAIWRRMIRYIEANSEYENKTILLSKNSDHESDVEKEDAAFEYDAKMEDAVYGKEFLSKYVKFCDAQEQDMRTILLMHLKRRSTKEIAASIGKSEDWVRNTLNRKKRELWREFRKWM
jgi:RNA polymerase sigma factor (sigma-70 family)